MTSPGNNGQPKTRHARDAVIAICITAVVIASMVITNSIAALWLLAIMLFVMFR